MRKSVILCVKVFDAQDGPLMGNLLSVFGSVNRLSGVLANLIC